MLCNVSIFDREDKWFERGVKEAIYDHCEQPSFISGHGLQHQLSPTYNGVLKFLLRCLNPHSHLASDDLYSS